MKEEEKNLEPGFYGFTVSSDLAADRETVWAHVADPTRLNREFFPFLKMTFPRDVQSLSPETVPLGRKLCRSWILLLGLLPVEYDDVMLTEIHPGQRFQEDSAMLLQKRWLHRRTLEEIPGGCRVTDRIAFSPRLPGAAVLQKRLFHTLFRYRHLRLKKLFGAL